MHALFLLFVTGLTHAADVKPMMAVNFEYRRHGVTICQGQREMLSGETYQVCDLSQDGLRRVLRLKAVRKDARISELEAEYDEIEPDGHIRPISRPMVSTLDREPASLSEGSIAPDGTTDLILEFKATAYAL